MCVATCVVVLESKVTEDKLETGEGRMNQRVRRSQKIRTCYQS